MATIVLVSDEKGNIKRIERREQGPTFLPFPETRNDLKVLHEIKQYNPIQVLGRPLLELTLLNALRTSPHLTEEEKDRYARIVVESRLGDDFDQEFEPTPAVQEAPADTGKGKGNKATYGPLQYFIDP